MRVAVEHRLEYVSAEVAFLQKFQLLLMIVALDWVTNDLKIEGHGHDNEAGKGYIIRGSIASNDSNE